MTIFRQVSISPAKMARQNMSSFFIFFFLFFFCPEVAILGEQMARGVDPLDLTE